MNKQVRVPNPFLWLSFAILGVLAILVVYWILIVQRLAWPERGLFGDSFGAVNTLFSGLAFAGLLVAIFLQQKQLEYQRKDLESQQEELKLTRDELKGQKDQLTLQNETLKLQLFENKFFQLMRLYDEITKSLQIAIKDESDDKLVKKITGKDCFEYLWNKYEESYGKNECAGMEVEQLKIFNEDFYWKYQFVLNPYFNHLRIFLDFIDLSTISDKQFYADLVQAQLSQYELLLLFYLCISKRFHDLNALITKYSLFNTFAEQDQAESTFVEEILLDDQDRELYEERAYRKNMIKQPSSEE